MRKIAIALGAIAFTMSAAAIPAVAATKPAKDAVVAAEPSKTAKPKKQVVRKKVVTAKYERKCKPGLRWDATASLSAGACVKPQAKIKVKKAGTKAADAPAPVTPATPKKTS